MTRAVRDTIGYVVIIAISVVFLVWAIPNYTPAYPGYGASPALVPNVVVCVMLIMAILAALRNLLAFWKSKPLSKDEGGYPDAPGGFTQVGQVRLLHLVSVMAPCVLLVPALGWFGYLGSSFIYLLVLQYILGRREPLPALILATSMVAIMYFAMRYVFSVPLPGH